MINAAKHLEQLSDYAKGIAVRIKVSGIDITADEADNLRFFYEKAQMTAKRSIDRASKRISQLAEEEKPKNASSDMADHCELRYDFENETLEARAERHRIENRD